MKGDTRYSEKVKGNTRNHGFSQRFDESDGYVGIQQYDGEKVVDRVLLSPAQVKALLQFIGAPKS